MAKINLRRIATEETSLLCHSFHLLRRDGQVNFYKPKAMKTYSVSAETTYRVFKNWIVEAKDKKSSLIKFRDLANIGNKTKLKILKITAHS